MYVVEKILGSDLECMLWFYIFYYSANAIAKVIAQSNLKYKLDCFVPQQ